MNRSRVTGDLTASGLLYADIANDRVGIGSTIPGNKLSLPDSAKIGLGNAEDLTLFHDGTHSKLKNSTGFLVLESDSFALNNGAGSENIIKGFNGGAVELYYNNSKKLETTNTGAVITGILTATGNVNFAGDVYSTSNNPWIYTSNGGSGVRAGIGLDGANQKIDFSTAGSSNVRLRIDSSGRLLVGHTAAIGDIHGPQGTTNRNPFIQIHGANTASAGAALISWKNSAGAYYAPTLFLAHSGSDTKGTNAVIPANGEFGNIVFSGDDGTDFVKGAMIKARLDGTPGDNDMPGRLGFYTTADGAQEPTERLRIDNKGRVTLYDSEGIKLSAKASGTYSEDGTLSYYATDNGVYLNGAGANGWLRLNAAGTANDRTSINLSGHSRTNGDAIYFKTNSTERLNITSGGCVYGSNFGFGADNRWKIRPNTSNTELAFEYSTSSTLADTNIKAFFNPSGRLLIKTVPHATSGTMGDYGLMFQASTTPTDGQVIQGITFNPHDTQVGRARAGIAALANANGGSHPHAGADLVFMTRFSADGHDIDVATDEKLRINSSGYMGVKRSTPLANLHTTNNELAIGANPTSAAAPNATYDGLVVDGEAASFINIRSRGDGNDSYCRLAFSDDTRSRGYVEYRHKDGGGDDTMRFATLGTERMRIDGNGKIIVATGQLHSTRVLAKFGIDCQGLDIYDGVGTVANYGLAFYNDPNSNKANGIGFFNDDGQTCGGYIVHQDKGSGNLGDIVIATSATSNSPVERMRITKDGIVTIGNSLPSASGALHLYQGGNDPYIYIQRGSGDSSTTIGGIFFKNSTNNLALIQAKSDDINDGHMLFHTMGAGTLTQRMKITKEGRVGIGLDTPEGALHVRADNQGTDTAFFVGSSAGDRFFALNELSGQINFGNCLMSFYDNSLREILTLRNTYSGQTGMGNMIVWRGASASKTGDIRVYNTATNSSQSKMDMSASGGVGIEINHLGHVTKPNQPNFLTHGSNDNGSANSTNLLNIGNTYINIGSHYNTGNGRFTCPTGGIYYFYCMWTSDNSTSSPVIYFYVNGSQSQVGALNYNSQYAGTYMAQCFSLNANDYVQCSMRDWNNSTPSPWQQWWGGYLIQ